VVGEDWTIPLASLVIVVSAVLVLSCGQPDRIRPTYTDTAELLTLATVVGVSKKSEQWIGSGFVHHGLCQCLVRSVYSVFGVTDYRTC